MSASGLLCMSFSQVASLNQHQNVPTTNAPQVALLAHHTLQASWPVESFFGSLCMSFLTLQSLSDSTAKPTSKKIYSIKFTECKQIGLFAVEMICCTSERFLEHEHSSFPIMHKVDNNAQILVTKCYPQSVFNPEPLIVLLLRSAHTERKRTRKRKRSKNNWKRSKNKRQTSKKIFAFAFTFAWSEHCFT